MGHAQNSPSSFFRRRLCPGSKRMEADQPDTDNIHSLTGTAAHTVLAAALQEGKTPGYWLDQVVPVDTADGKVQPITITKEDNAAVWVAYDYALRRREEMGPETVMGLEEKVDPGVWLGRQDMDGSCDISLVAPTAMEFIDYKHGSGKIVEIVDKDGRLNEQTALYGIGKCAQIDWSKYSTTIPITLTIVQPRAPHPQGPIRPVTMPAWELFQKIDEYKAIAARTDEENAPLIPGEEQCHFCKGKGICPALNQAAMDVFKPVPDPSIPYAVPPAEVPQTGASEWDSIEAVLGRPTDQLSLEHMVRALDAEKLVQAWFKSIREELTKQAMSGVEIPQHKLVYSTTHRKYSVDDDSIIAKLARLRTQKGEAIGKANVIKVSPITPAQAEKTIRPMVSEKAWKNIDKLIIKPEGKPTLVPLTDPREPIKNAQEVFAPVETTEHEETKQPKQATHEAWPWL